MPNSPEQPWSGNPNAPQIPSLLYHTEKEIFSGQLIGLIFYGTPAQHMPTLTLPIQYIFLGIVVALFFRCMGVLLSPVNPIRGGVKLALVFHTVAMFTFLTIPIGIRTSTLPVDFIDNREYPGSGEFPPGPIGYDYHLSIKATTTAVFKTMFPLNQWLADGLLVRPVSGSAHQMINRDDCSSYTVAMLFIL